MAGLGKAKGRECVRTFVSAHGLRTLLKARKRRFYAGLRTSAHSAHRTSVRTKAPLRPSLRVVFFFHYYFTINITRIMEDERARVCGVRNVRKTGNVGFTLFCGMLAMCGWRVRNYASAHAPSGTLTFWQRFDGARQVPAIQGTSCGGLPSARHPRDDGREPASKCQSREANFSDECIRVGLGAIPSGNQETARECAQVLPAKGSERVALRPAVG